MSGILHSAPRRFCFVVVTAAPCWQLVQADDGREADSEEGFLVTALLQLLQHQGYRNTIIWGKSRSCGSSCQAGKHLNHNSI